jgi:hypothetical protein
MQATQTLVEAIFLDAFRNSFVVSPIFFPAGSVASPANRDAAGSASSRSSTWDTRRVRVSFSAGVPSVASCGNPRYWSLSCG